MPADRAMLFRGLIALAVFCAASVALFCASSRDNGRAVIAIRATAMPAMASIEDRP